jgi:mutator protein MutT
MAHLVDPKFRRLVESNLKEFDYIQASTDGRSAAVAVTIVDSGFGPVLSGMAQFKVWQESASLILTRRSSRLRNHAGQWSFPGGRLEEGETPELAALREMREEIGLKVSEENIIGRLDDFVTRSGFIMTPVVCWAGNQKNLEPNPAEVESIHRIPISEFLRDDAPLLDPGDGPHPVLRMPVGDDWIAAPTAAIIYQFREVAVRGKSTRVAHFDQPKFAWS